MEGEKSVFGRVILPFGAVLVVALGLILLMNQKAVSAQLDAWKLIPRPEPFTELYLDNAADLFEKLPKDIKGGEKISFSFTIHNLEGKKVTYPYVVYIVDVAGRKIPIDAKSITLADQASTTITESYMFPKKSPSIQNTVFINLVGRSQSLHFFVPSKN